MSARLPYENVYARLLANSAKPDDQNECGCWEWQGHLSTRGYGAMSKRVPGRRTPRKALAHREMEQHFRDLEAEREFDLAQPGDWWSTPLVMGIKAPPMDPEETTEHLCYRHRCCNPDHWIHVTRAQNSALMRKRVLSATASLLPALL